MRPDHVIIHDSDSPYGNSYVIDNWHKQRGFRYHHSPSSTYVHTGYHYLILNGYGLDSSQYCEMLDGSIEAARPENAIGAHARDRGMNSKSIGVCFIGPGKEGQPKFTRNQWLNGLRLVDKLMSEYGIFVDQVLGHKELTQGKTDPRFDMDLFRRLLREMRG